MKQLLCDPESIGLYFANHTLGEAMKRVALSAGVREVSGSESHHAYQTGSHVPALPWSPCDKPAMFRRSPGTSGNTLAIVRLPPSEWQRIRLQLKHLNRTSKAEIQRLGTDLMDTVAPQVQGCDTVVAGICVNRPGLQTVTIDRKVSRLIGLHLDSWDRLPVENRATATNRISFNIGEQDRHLLFVNLPIKKIHDLLLSRKPDFVFNHSGEILGSFFREFPDYPVVRVTIAPGEAYIAPTENMIHDGSTEGTTVESQSFTIRGRFSIC